MSYAIPVELRKSVGLLCCALVFSWAAPVAADPKPLSKDDQAKVDKAIDRAVNYLKLEQRKKGDWPQYWQDNYVVGQCALPAYALLEAGVPLDDPVIQKAADFLRPRVLKTNQTYEMSLAVLFFDRLGDPKDKKLIQSLALRLLASQHRRGGWSYRCLTVSSANEAALLKTLEELSKQMKEGGKSAKEALHNLGMPRALRSLTIFQDSENHDWREQSQMAPTPPPLTGGSDNSNTQFALLALWVAQRYGIPMDLTFCLLVERFERSQLADGRWTYRENHRIASQSSLLAYPSMTCVGLLALAIGRGMKLSTSGTPSSGLADRHVLEGLAALYHLIGSPQGTMNRRVPHQDVYFLWSVERVGMLYNLSTIGYKDWYRWGAEILVSHQMSNGSWPGVVWQRETCPVPPDYGSVLNTAFALLFLKHSHPMKDLTPKLPFTAKELNEGIARLQTGDKLPERTTTTSGKSKSLESQSQKRNP